MVETEFVSSLYFSKTLTLCYDIECYPENKWSIYSSILNAMIFYVKKYLS